MAVKSDRVEARLSPDQRERIERAATLSEESMSSFMVSAAVERAEAVIADHSSTAVPSDYFDQLLAALDEAPESSPRLAAAARRSRKRPRIRTA